nr:GDP-fucose protein O-fucosyltransferase [Tanacetum cinerariifolium]
MTQNCISDLKLGSRNKVLEAKVYRKWIDQKPSNPTPTDYCCILIDREVYGGEAQFSALRKLFPQIEDKKSLGTSVERAQIKGNILYPRPLITKSAYISIFSLLAPLHDSVHNATVCAIISGLKMILNSDRRVI